MTIDSDIQVSNTILCGNETWYFFKEYRRINILTNVYKEIRRNPAVKKKNTQ